MALAVLLIIAALIIGGIGLAVAALKWLLIIAAVVLLVGVIAGFATRSAA